MATIPLWNRHGEVVGQAVVDDEDFAVLNAHRWSLTAAGYAVRSVRKAERETSGGPAVQSMHREIMQAKTGQMVDHANGNTLDNRRANLRFADAYENARNRRTKSSAASPFKGVRRVGRFFHAVLEKGGVAVFYASYHTAEEAAVAYDKAALQHFGNFAATNFPDSANRPDPVPRTMRSQQPNARLPKSGYRGVIRVGKKWRVNYPGAHVNGYFVTPEDAAREYDRAALIYYGEHAVLNFPTPQ